MLMIVTGPFWVKPPSVTTISEEVASPLKGTSIRRTRRLLKTERLSLVTLISTYEFASVVLMRFSGAVPAAL
ncbi:hypothetical protein D3C86_2077670 [compost metagenome]